MHPPFLLRGGVNLLPNFQKEGVLTGTRNIFREGVDLFKGKGGGCNLHIKDKLKSELFNNKKGLSKKGFSWS